MILVLWWSWPRHLCIPCWPAVWFGFSDAKCSILFCSKDFWVPKIVIWPSWEFHLMIGLKDTTSDDWRFRDSLSSYSRWLQNLLCSESVDTLRFSQKLCLGVRKCRAARFCKYFPYHLDVTVIISILSQFFQISTKYVCVMCVYTHTYFFSFYVQTL